MNSRILLSGFHEVGTLVTAMPAVLAGRPQALLTIDVAEPASLSILDLAMAGIGAARRRRAP